MTRALAAQIFDAYCSKKSLDRSHVRFLFDGNRINGNQTPQDVRPPPFRCPSPVVFGAGGVAALTRARYRHRRARSSRSRTATASTP